MNEETLKELLNSKHKNAWVHLYKRDSSIRNLLLPYGEDPKTDFEIYKIFYMFMNDIKEIPKAYCGNSARYKSYSVGFYKICNNYIVNKPESCPICHEQFYKERTKKTIKTNMEKYGVCNISQVPSVKEQKMKTCLENFGETSNLKSEEIKKKIKITNLKKYGVTYPLKNDEILNKVKKTNLSKYGYEHPLSSPEIRKKIEQTNLSKYGCEHTLSSPEIRKKIEQTNIKKYGVKNVLSNEHIKHKISSTNLLKYGVKYPIQNKDIHNKVKESTKKSLGVEYPSQNPNIVEKIKKTVLERYGSEHYSQTTEYKQHIQDIWYEKRYDIILNNLDDNYVTLFDEDDLKFRKNNELFPFWCNYCDDLFYHVHKQNMVKCKCQKLHGFSQKEKELLDYIKSLIPTITVLENDRTLLKPREVDIYIPELKLAFEFNGMYWHNDEHIENTLHQDKVLKCYEQGVNLIHIFEDEWDSKNAIIKERIKNKLKISNRIYARKCDVRVIDKMVSNNFVDNYHIQGSTVASINIGLYYENDLVAVMTFGKSRFDKKVQYELIRYCSKTTVVGGASKLLKFFEKTFKPESLMTYADMSWSSGDLYEKLGFESYGMTEPGYFYYDPSIQVRISRQKCQKHKLVKQGFDKSLTERTICCELLGYYKIYDAGNLKYIKKYN